VLSPGVELMWDGVAGLRAANEQGRILQAWKAGAETTALRRQLEAMRDGGTFAIAIRRPRTAARRPVRARLPGRELLEAGQAEVEGPDPRRQPGRHLEGALFKRVWAESYPGIVEYRPQHKATGVDAAAGSSSSRCRTTCAPTC
jgi:hypothetical protein